MTDPSTMSTIPPGSVVVTPYQMYDEMRTIAREVNHLSSIVDPALHEIRSDVGENKAELKAHDLRLRALESRVWFAAGIATAIGGTGGWIASLLTGGLA